MKTNIAIGDAVEVKMFTRPLTHVTLSPDKPVGFTEHWIPAVVSAVRPQQISVTLENGDSLIIGRYEPSWRIA